MPRILEPLRSPYTPKTTYTNLPRSSTAVMALARSSEASCSFIRPPTATAGASQCGCTQWAASDRHPDTAADCAGGAGSPARTYPGSHIRTRSSNTARQDRRRAQARAQDQETTCASQRPSGSGSASSSGDIRDDATPRGIRSGLSPRVSDARSYAPHVLFLFFGQVVNVIRAWIQPPVCQLQQLSLRPIPRLELTRTARHRRAVEEMHFLGRVRVEQFATVVPTTQRDRRHMSTGVDAIAL